MSDIILTPSALLGFLSQIDELKDKEINFGENDNKLVVMIDSSQYIIDASEATEISVDSEVMEQVEEANEDGYDEIDDIEEVGADEIEGGIIKELVKTLALGGLVRMTKHALEKA